MKKLLRVLGDMSYFTQCHSSVTAGTDKGINYIGHIPSTITAHVCPICVTTKSLIQFSASQGKRVKESFLIWYAREEVTYCLFLLCGT